MRGPKTSPFYVHSLKGFPLCLSRSPRFLIAIYLFYPRGQACEFFISYIYQKMMMLGANKVKWQKSLTTAYIK